jgi:hypothetical protein
MGRRDRERVERIKSGQEEPFSPGVQKALDNPISRKIVATASRQRVISEMTKGSTQDVVSNLDEMVVTGNLASRKLKESLMRNAPKQMDKAIRDFQKQGKDVSVESLCYEAKNTPEFVNMCARVGLEMSWFEDLAKERMEVNGL